MWWNSNLNPLDSANFSQFLNSTFKDSLMSDSNLFHFGPIWCLAYIIGIGAQSTFVGAQRFCPKNMYEKLSNAQILHDSWPKSYQNTQIFMIFARKINKIPEFYMIFARQIPKFYIIIAGKIFFPNFGGHLLPLPLLPPILCLWAIQCMFDYF